MVRAEKAKDDNEADSAPPEFNGLYYPLSYVLRTWIYLREYGVLPEAGGLNDQDWRLIEHDWPIVSERYIYIRKHGRPTVEYPDDAPNWRAAIDG